MKVNDSFRAWTRGTTFCLTMGRTQVAVLVAICETPSSAHHHIGTYHPRFNLWVTGAKGLIIRGLLTHNDPDILKKKFKRYPFYTEIYTVTPAGLLVAELLKQSGVYQELADEFREYDRQYQLREVRA